MSVPISYYAPVPKTNAAMFESESGDLACYILDHIHASLPGSTDKTMTYAVAATHDEVADTFSAMGVVKVRNLPKIEGGRFENLNRSSKTESAIPSMILGLDFIRMTLTKAFGEFEKKWSGESSILLPDELLSELKKVRELLPLSSEIMLVEVKPSQLDEEDYVFTMGVLRDGENSVFFESAANYPEQKNHLYAAYLCANLAQPLRALLDAIARDANWLTLVELMWLFNNAVDVSRYQCDMSNVQF